MDQLRILLPGRWIQHGTRNAGTTDAETEVGFQPVSGGVSQKRTRNRTPQNWMGFAIGFPFSGRNERLHLLSVRKPWEYVYVLNHQGFCSSLSSASADIGGTQASTPPNTIPEIPLEHPVSFCFLLSSPILGCFEGMPKRVPHRGSPTIDPPSLASLLQPKYIPQKSGTRNGVLTFYSSPFGDLTYQRLVASSK